MASALGMAPRLWLGSSARRALPAADNVRLRATARFARQGGSEGLESELRQRGNGNGTVTNEEIASYPWAAPGWRDAWLSKQPDSVQQATFIGTAAALLAASYASHTVIGPWIVGNVPLMGRFMSNAPFILGPMFAAAGVSHFTLHQMFCGFYPAQGSWGGLWRLPGSPSFHVNWTGVAEIVGGFGLVIGVLHPDWAPQWLGSASAAGLCAITYAVTPSNFYMWSHNSPGPLTVEQLDASFGPGGVTPQSVHLIRGLLQVFLVSTFYGLAVTL